MSMRLSEHADIDLMVEQDIGGTNASNDGGYLSMKNYARALFYVELGTWDSVMIWMSAGFNRQPTHLEPA